MSNWVVTPGATSKSMVLCFIIFVREPGDVELGSDPRCDF